MLKKARIKFDVLFIQETDNTWIQGFRYLFVASAALMADFLVLITLTELLDVDNIIVSSAAGFSLGLIINYLLSIRWVFTSGSGRNKRSEFLMFCVIGLIGLAMTAALMWVMTSVFSMYYIFAKAIVTCIVFFWNFLARKFLLFNVKPQDIV